MSEEPHKVIPPDDFEKFVQNLAQLSPSAPVRSRNQLLFEAGRASTRIPNLWLWQASTIGLALLSAGLGFVLLWPAPAQVQVIERERERIVIQYRDREPQPAPESPQTTSTDYTVSLPRPESDSFAEETRKMLRVRNDVIRFGVEMLPRNDSASQSQPPATPIEGEMFESLYLPRGTYAAPIFLKRRVATEEE